MRNRTILTATALLTAVISGCSSNGGDSEPIPRPSAAEHTPTATPEETATGSAKQAGLEPIWAPKLAAAQEGAIEACMSPSSSACAQAIGRIMNIVEQLDVAITQTGQRYPESTAHIVKMRDEEETYKDEGCEGDPTADNPNSNCWGVVAITMGASSLQLTLFTDDLG